MWELQVNEVADSFDYQPPFPTPFKKKTYKQKRDVNTGQLRKFKEKNKIKENQQALLEK